MLPCFASPARQRPKYWHKAGASGAGMQNRDARRACPALCCFGASLVVLTLLLVELAPLLRRGILVLLVPRYQVVHVGLRLCELHLVHALPCVPMQERLAPEHRREVFRNALEHLLDGRGVT